MPTAGAAEEFGAGLVDYKAFGANKSATSKTAIDSAWSLLNSDDDEVSFTGRRLLAESPAHRTSSPGSPVAAYAEACSSAVIPPQNSVACLFAAQVEARRIARATLRHLRREFLLLWPQPWGYPSQPWLHPRRGR